MTPLRVHSHYTLLGATLSVEDIAALAAADGLAAVALTDRNALYGAVAFERACRAVDVQPLIGMTLRVRPPQRALAGKAADLVLIAQDADGYHNLCRLSSLLQASPQREAKLQRGVSWPQFAAHSTGLLAIDAGRNGHLARALLTDDQSGAHAYAAALLETVGDRAYLGLEIQPCRALRALPVGVMTVAQQSGVPAVALHPAYCQRAAERATLQLLTAIAHNCRVEDVPQDRLADGGDSEIDLHWLTPAALQRRYSGYWDALARTDEVAARCASRCLPTGQAVWPRLEWLGAEPAAAALKRQAVAGRRRRYDADFGSERLSSELALINMHGFAALFLVVADIVQFARGRGIPVGTRGSVANSLVAYCLGITTVDPLEHDLLFERFLNPMRRTLPDIDLDFCSRRRDEVLTYVCERYGAEHVALVATVNTFKHKSAVREAAKALGADAAQLKRLVKLLPRGWHPDPRRRDGRTLAELADSVERDDDRRVLRAAAPLIGLPHHLGVHPGGVVITPTKLTDYVPLQWSPKGFPITQFDHSDMEHIGLPKLDLLGIRALTLLADTADWVRRHVDPNFDLEQIPDGDRATADLLARAETVGVFQCESHGAQRTLRQLNARTVRDLALANAFFKPGPASGGMAAAFVRRYRGEEKVTFLHPALEPILAPTMGVLLFQEQIMRLATEIAGLDWSQANQLRRGMSRFDAARMEALKEQFTGGCCRPAVAMSAADAETLWKQVLAFAGYGFNQGHATAYAAVSYRSAYMRAHWPAAFLTARLVNGGGFYHPAVYIAEARRLGLRVRPPHVNHSERRFVLDSNRTTLWMGLGQVRDLRRKAISAISAQRPFATLDELLQRVSLHPKEVAHLICCGALDGLGTSRAALLEQAQGRRAQRGQLRMAFADRPVVASETLRQRLAWERKLLGFPVGVHPLQMAPPLAVAIAVRDLGRHAGKTVEIAGARLPSWDSSGFLVDDGDCYVRAVFPRSHGKQRKPPVWEPVALKGQLRSDRFGNTAFVLQEWRPLPTDESPVL